jgi:hypothetical protein
LLNAGWLLFLPDVQLTPIPDFVLSPVNDPRYGIPSLVYDWMISFFTPVERNSNRLRWLYLDPPYNVAQRMLDSWPEEMGSVHEKMGQHKEGWRAPELEEPGDILCFQSLYWVGLCEWARV